MADDQNTAARLTRALLATDVPLFGVSIGKRTDRTTWRVSFRPEATETDRGRAQTLIDQFDPTDPAVVAAEVDEQARGLDIDLAVMALATVVYRYLPQAILPPFPAFVAEVRAVYRGLIVVGR